MAIYNNLSDIMVGGDYDPNKRGLVTGPGGYAGDPHGGTTNEGGYGPAGQFGGPSSGGWGMGYEGPGSNATSSTAQSAYDRSQLEQWGEDDYSAFYDKASPEAALAFDALNQSVSYGDDQTVSGLTWGGPSAFRGPHNDNENFKKVNTMLKQMTPELSSEVDKDVYAAFFGKIAPGDVTDAQKSSLATALGYRSVSDMESNLGTKTMNTMAAYHAETTSFQAMMDSLKDKYEGVKTSWSEGDETDKAVMLGKAALTGIGAGGTYGLAQQHGWGPVMSAMGMIGAQAKMGQTMFGLITGKPGKSAEVVSWARKDGLTLTEAIETGVVKASDVMKTGDLETGQGEDIRGSLGYSFKNSPVGEFLGYDPMEASSFQGAYVDPQKAIDHGFMYSGTTQGMTDDHFGLVSGALADPYGQTMGYMMSASEAPDRGSANLSSDEQAALLEAGEAGEATAIADVSDFDDGQMQMFNKYVSMGYSEEYAAEYVRSFG